MSDKRQDQGHNGPIKNPKQLLAASFFAFVAPVVVIMGLVYLVSTGTPRLPTDPEGDRALAERIQKVGHVELREAPKTLRNGEAVFKGQCFACHEAGVSGAPKFGDASAWAPRIATGFEALVNSALKGKNLMPAQGGGNFSDLEIARGVAYMANAGGAKFEEPKAPAGAPAAN